MPAEPLEPELGHLEPVDPRSIWKHEALDFTPWLASNADGLATALGIDLEITGSEHPVGGFSLDLIGRDVTHDKPLIIENQLAGSDHSHLGQLLTYAAGTGAATIVWVATEVRDEHRQALTWLNEVTGPDIHFFGVELEVVRIGSSLPAPLFNVVVLPNDWQKSVRAAAAAGAAGGKAPLYVEFWSMFLDRLRADRPDWSRARQGTRNNWFPMSVGLPPGCSITSSFAAGGKLRHEFYIDAQHRRSARSSSTHWKRRRNSSRRLTAGLSPGNDSTRRRPLESPSTATGASTSLRSTRTTSTGSSMRGPGCEQRSLPWIWSS